MSLAISSFSDRDSDRNEAALLADRRLQKCDVTRGAIGWFLASPKTA